MGSKRAQILEWLGRLERAPLEERGQAQEVVLGLLGEGDLLLLREHLLTSGGGRRARMVLGLFERTLEEGELDEEGVGVVASALVEALFTSALWGRRLKKRVVRLLCTIGKPAIAPLCEVLEEQVQQREVIWAIIALGRLEAVDAAAPLARILRDGGFWRAGGVVRALARIGAVAPDAVIAAMESIREQEAHAAYGSRDRAASVLWWMGRESADPEGCLRYSNALLRKGAIRSLGERGDASARKALKSQTGHNVAATVRVMALAELAALGEKDAFGRLRALVQKSKQRGLREKALKKLCWAVHKAHYAKPLKELLRAEGTDFLMRRALFGHLVKLASRAGERTGKEVDFLLPLLVEEARMTSRPDKRVFVLLHALLAALKAAGGQALHTIGIRRALDEVVAICVAILEKKPFAKQKSGLFWVPGMTTTEARYWAILLLGYCEEPSVLSVLLERLLPRKADRRARVTALWGVFRLAPLVEGGQQMVLLREVLALPEVEAVREALLVLMCVWEKASGEGLLREYLGQHRPTWEESLASPLIFHLLPCGGRE